MSLLGKLDELLLCADDVCKSRSIPEHVLMVKMETGNKKQLNNVCLSIRMSVCVCVCV